MDQVSENRANERKACNERILFEPGRKKEGSQSLRKHGICIDIGAGGIGMVTDLKLEEGEIIKLYLPATEHKIPLPVYAEVISSKPAGDHAVRAGLRFLG